MQKYLLISLLVFSFIHLEAKKVKFSVDMTGYEINTTKIHIGGDFQKAAGYSENFDPSSTEMTLEMGNIYSVVVEVPAFAKYEYKFLNGDQWYDSEFVPEESRVGYDFNDNRWVYVDSIDNSVLELEPVVFSSNSPLNKKLLRVYVDLSKIQVSSEGVYLAGTWNSLNPLQTRLYSFGSDIFENIVYVSEGKNKYKFYNGKANPEVLPNDCSVDGYREITISDNKVVESVCFSYCVSCEFSDVELEYNSNDFESLVNDDEIIMTIPENIEKYEYQIFDIYGNLLCSKNGYDKELKINTSNYQSGVYFINLKNDNFNKNIRFIKIR